MNENSALPANRAGVARSKPKVYLESSFLLALFGAESERSKIAREIVDDAREGRIEIVASTLSIVECELNTGVEGDELLSTFFEMEWLVRTNVDPFVANTARDLRNQLGSLIALSPNAWLHAATALWEGCSYLMTFDKRLLKLSGQPEMKFVQVLFPTRPWDAGQMSLTDLEGVMPETSKDLSRRSLVI